MDNRYVVMTPESDEALPSAAAFCLKIPVYEKFQFDREHKNPIFAIESYAGTLDCFCEECGRHSVFNRKDVPGYHEYHHLRNHVFALWFTCSRDQAHRIIFIFRSDQGILQKIGQYPSMADLEAPDLQKYRSLLEKTRFQELTRGVGLASHGVGIGAFVYLRRVFESLLEEAKVEASNEANWDQNAYENARMDEKIRILKDQLPPFLVEHKSLYGILSVGVHALSEQQCLQAFSTVKLGIELILDEMLEKKNRARKVAEASKSIALLGAALKKPQG